MSTTLDEEVPSTDGECSLREAILNANGGEKWPFPDCAAGSSGLDAPQTINFAEGLSGQITLGSQLPAVDAPLATEAGSWRGPSVSRVVCRSHLFAPAAQGEYPLSRKLQSGGHRCFTWGISPSTARGRRTP